MSESPDEPLSRADYWTLIRDVGVLQVKLLIDGLRDLVLLPASLIAGIISLLQNENGKPGPQFYQLIAVGKQSEAWINLFGALRNAPAEVDASVNFGDADIDDIVSRVETFVVDEYQRGGVTKQARDRMKQALDAMQERSRRRSRPE